MDSAEFLDLLGNANRRRILELLARKPCYVTEISEFLGVSPKAVIDHLRKLENAGLVESRTDDRRRKYFSIARHIRLEVTVSPYEFGTKSAYPTSSRLDIRSCRRVHIELEDGSVDPVPEDRDDESGRAADEGDGNSAVAAGDGGGVDAEGVEPTASGGKTERAESSDAVVSLVEQFRDFEQLERELSLAHRWAEGRMTELRERLADRLESSDPRLVSEVLLSLAENERSVEELSRDLEIPPRVIEEVLEDLSAQGVVARNGQSWHLET